ncbi:MAG: hypothetical protein ACRDIY_05685 [Chloroflexota bacterium]
MPVPILILTPDPAVRESLRRAAEEFGSVVTTPKPALAIYLAAVHEPRVAILDLDVVPRDGRSGLVSTLRQRFKAAVIGVGNGLTPLDASALGLAAMVEKPIDLGTLMVEIDRLLSESAEARGQ